MANVTNQWAHVLDSADPATRALILQLQFEDLAISENDVTAQTTANLENDQVIARTLFQNDLKQYQQSRNIEILAFKNEIPSAPPKPKIPRLQCRACLDYFDIEHYYLVHDQHCYCGDCLGNLFTSSMTDKTLYPPRCCKNIIPLEDVERFIDAELVTEFKAKKEELEDSKQTYCHVSTCSAYIGDANKNENTGVCLGCAEKTCLLCKQAAHGGDCPADEAAQQTLDLAQKEGWQKCPGCEKLVELDIGCNHMTCRCSAQFCYVCGVTWKNCGCPQFDHNRLLRRADQIAERDGAAVGDVMAHLEVNHECTNHEWRWQHGAAQCETCGDNLPTFIFRCTRCLEQICRRCRENRS